MCTYATQSIAMAGSAKGAAGWFNVSRATVYIDHPHHAGAEHTLNVDVIDPAAGPSARVALELTKDAARALARAINEALDGAPAGLLH